MDLGDGPSEEELKAIEEEEKQDLQDQMLEYIKDGYTIHWFYTHQRWLYTQVNNLSILKKVLTTINLYDRLVLITIFYVRDYYGKS